MTVLLVHDKYQHDVGEERVMASYENVHVALNSLIVDNIN